MFFPTVLLCFVGIYFVAPTLFSDILVTVKQVTKNELRTV